MVKLLSEAPPGTLTRGAKHGGLFILAILFDQKFNSVRLCEPGISLNLKLEMRPLAHFVQERFGKKHKTPTLKNKNKNYGEK